MPNLLHPRDELVRTMERIYRYRMTTTSGGNLSILDPDGSIWITPARIDKGAIRRDDIIHVLPDGTAEGPHAPSSEFPFHQSIYAARPDLRAIVHAHPVALVAFSIVGQVPNTRLFHQSRHVCGDVAFAPYALPGSSKLADNIAQTFASPAHPHCVVLENHGVVVGGDSLSDAFQRFETVEFTAKTIIKARLLGEVRYLTDEQIELPRQNAQPLPSFTPDPPSSAEKDLRRTLRDFIRRGYQQRLLISTEGSVSARLDPDSFLISPYRIDRSTIDLDDLVLIRDGRAEAGKTPSRASRNHAALYARHPEFRALANAYTVNATAFSVTGAPLSTRTIPEGYIVLRDINRIPYGVQFTDSSDLASRLSPANPIALLENDGVLVAGSSILEAFDRLEVLESTAEALINARALAPLAPMPDSVIDELRSHFFN